MPIARISPTGAPNGRTVTAGTAAGQVPVWDPALLDGQGDYAPQTLVLAGDGQLRFLVGPAGSGANFADLDSALAAAVLAGGEQTIFVVPGTAITSGANPLQLPPEISLVGLPGSPPTLDVALQLDPTAAADQLVQDVIVTGSSLLASGFDAAVIVPTLDATARLTLRRVRGLPAAGAFPVGLAVAELDGDLITDQCEWSGSTGAVVDTSTDPAGDWSDVGSTFVCTSALGAALLLDDLGAAVTLSATFRGADFLSDNDGIDFALSTFEGRWVFDGCNVICSGANDIALANQGGFGGAGGLEWRGGSLRADLTIDPSGGGFLGFQGALIVPPPGGANTALLAAQQFGGLTSFFGCNMVVNELEEFGSADNFAISGGELRVNDTCGIIGDGSIDGVRIDGGAAIGINPLFELTNAFASLDLRNNEIATDPNCTLVATDGGLGGTIDTGGNTIQGNAAWVLPADPFSGAGVNALLVA